MFASSKRLTSRFLVIHEIKSFISIYFERLNTRTTKMVKMTNLDFFTDILCIYNSVFLETRMTFSKIYKKKTRALYRILKFFLFLPFTFISLLQILHFDHR